MDNLPFPTELTQFALWLISGGATGVIVSLLLERIPQFKNWKSPLKTTVTLGLFMAIPFFGKVVLWAITTLDPATLKTIQDTLTLAFSGLVAWGASQFAHGYDKDYLQ